MTCWTEEDSKAANKQGWDIFHTTLAFPRHVEIERLDEQDIFETDDEAIRFVSQQALGGDPLTIKAITYLAKEGAQDADLFPLQQLGIWKPTLSFNWYETASD